MSSVTIISLELVNYEGIQDLAFNDLIIIVLRNIFAFKIRMACQQGYI
jgi:hypothetical protein